MNRRSFLQNGVVLASAAASGLLLRPQRSDARQQQLPTLTAQDEWHWCNKCQGLYFDGNGTGEGVCPAGGTHDRTGSGNYSLVINIVGNQSADAGQSYWAGCYKCLGLYLRKNDSNGICPAGGAHDPTYSGNYYLPYHARGTNDVNASRNGQNYWRYCYKCQGLCFIGNKTLGACPAGGAHAVQGSLDYILTLLPDNGTTSLTRPTGSFCTLRFYMGASVVNIANGPMNLFDVPNGNVIGSLASGGVVTVTGGPVCTPDGSDWWLVNTGQQSYWAAGGQGDTVYLAVQTPNLGSDNRVNPGGGQ